MTDAIRYANRFESATVSGLAYTWPTHRLEYESSQELTGSFVALTGADYDYDQLGMGLMPKRNGREVVRFLAVATASGIEAEIDSAKQTLYGIGKGKLFTVDSDGSERWAWARIDQMPDIKLTVDNRIHLPIILSFVRFSDWYGDQETPTFSLSGDPATI